MDVFLKLCDRFLFAWHDMTCSCLEISSWFSILLHKTQTKDVCLISFKRQEQFPLFVQFFHLRAPILPFGALSSIERRKRNFLCPQKSSLWFVQISTLRWKAKVRERKERRNWFYVRKVLQSTCIAAASREHFFPACQIFKMTKSLQESACSEKRKGDWSRNATHLKNWRCMPRSPRLSTNRCCTCSSSVFNRFDISRKKLTRGGGFHGFTSFSTFFKKMICS